MAVHERILEGMWRSRLTQSELAKRAGVGAAYVAHLCAGRRRGSVEALHRIAEVLGQDPDVLQVEAGLTSQPGTHRYSTAVLLARTRGFILDDAGNVVGCDKELSESQAAMAVELRRTDWFWWPSRGVVVSGEEQ